MIIVIAGPTGIGKTALSIALANHFNTEIISGDSVQVYKGFDIGSAKVTTKEQQGIPHHLIDILEPNHSFNVAAYQTMVRHKITEFEERNLIPLIVGGTGLYIKSVLYDYNFKDAKRNTAKEEEYESYSNEELYQLLLDKDPLATNKIHPNNRKRVLQAIHRSDTNKISDNTNKDVPLYDFIIIGLTMERTKLYERINRRVDQMIEDGLEQEVEHLYKQQHNCQPFSAIGYKEWIPYFEGTCSKHDVIEKIKQHSRNLAKKQYTFFTHQFPVHWITVDPFHFDNTIQETIQYIEQKVQS